MQNSDLKIIGFREWVELPEWGLGPLRAKADTGAKTSAIDVVDWRERPNGLVEFNVATHRNKRDRIITIESKITRSAKVKSSTGEEQERFFVSTPVRIGTYCETVEFSLVNRHGMIYRMLLGRAALAGRFLVDPSSHHLLGKPVTKGISP